LGKQDNSRNPAFEWPSGIEKLIDSDCPQRNYCVTEK
jgi:hypothetical protein